VLPGHGPETTVGRERAYNPFLADLIAGGPGGRKPSSPVNQDSQGAGR
jgi:hydroxyacylglutathione hydrolase